ncbi:RNA polymerase sigma factor [Thalassococcus sp. S3]|uniref:RNA polymerase sigma factor n=1 Tax=Thalassococcus sp. S3 TaxID=2017482 RepID=UPI00102412EB|nr:RNA polymerase sigma factor [Thalassococcus sp. S3]QBF33227.1 RNA polymerase subunit sigma-70 [Thalassococcus sp. S3]
MTDPFSRNIVELLPNLRRYAMSLARRPDVADDLVQLTVEKALRQRAQFDPRQSLAPWLLRILRNAWIDETRRRKVRGEMLTAEDTEIGAHSDSAASAELQMEVRQTLEAIQRLPDPQRDVLILVCVEGLSYREAAEVLEVAIGTVMSRLARARIALAEAMGIDRGSRAYSGQPTNKTETSSR